MSLTRRDFIKASGAMSLAATMPEFLVRSCMAKSKRDSDRVLVIVELNGGNDGLNTLVPFGDDEYGRNRPTLALPANKLHKISDELGFHPEMAEFGRLYKDGHLSVVQGVGCANLDRDHEAAMRTWHSGDPDGASRDTGWLGRVADSRWRENDKNIDVAFVSSISKPFALNAKNAIIPAISSLDDLKLLEDASLSDGKSNNPLLQLVRQRTMESCAISKRVKAVADSSGGGDYPSFRLAEKLRTIGQLIRADSGIRIYFTELGGDGFGGFDNHANQIGNHCALLHQLSESTGAFVRDLKKDGLLDNVLMMTFSEFGRTVKENGRRGTGHGAAAPVFLAGGRLKGGLIGEHPSLSDLDNGALKFHTDFRRVYATALEKWLGFESKGVLGEQFEAVDFLKI
jgi:uncharacterized protein (DUF1501 family)